VTIPGIETNQIPGIVTIGLKFVKIYYLRPIQFNPSTRLDISAIRYLLTVVRRLPEPNILVGKLHML